MRKTLSLFLVFALVITGLIPQSAAAVGQASSAPTETDFIRIIHPVTVMSEDGSSEIGILEPETIWRVRHIDEGTVYIQWGDERGAVSEADIQYVSSDELSDDRDTFISPEQVDEQQFIGTVYLDADTVVFDEYDRPIAKLLAETVYPYVHADGDTYEIILGDRTGYIEVLSEQEPVDDNDERTEPEVDAVDDTDELASPERFTVSTATVKSQLTQQAPSFGKYFVVTSERAVVYDNSKRDANGNAVLTPIGYLEKGQQYPRVRDYGNWHRIEFGNRYGYVHKSATAPADGKAIKNENKSYSHSRDVFTTLKDVTVYDNTSGKLVPFAVILRGESHPVATDYGNWYRIIVADRVGYVRKSEVRLPFKTTDRFFQVVADNVIVYDNTKRDANGNQILEPIGKLQRGQIYPRVSDYGNWHRIQFGNRFGYVHKSGTTPASGNSLKNINTSYKNSKQLVEFTRDTIVYDNTSGELVPFAVIFEGQLHPIISSYGANWFRIDVSGRVGYVRSSNVLQEKITYTQYPYTFEELLNIQMRLNPQTDLYRNKNAYVSATYIRPNSSKTSGTVTATALNVREQPNTSSWIYGTLRQGQTVTIVREVMSGNSRWYEIKYNTWRNAKREDVARYLDPNNFDRFQFLVLSESANAHVDDLNKVLKGKGILEGKGSAFITAGQLHGLNEIYLISHALLETGNGTSALARGVVVDTVDGKKVTPRTVYNVFGIGAYDSCALRCGSEYAYKQGWFTPEAAIIGGAEFIGKQYVNHPSYKQNTLYKMRWNPSNPGTHQYATDIGWAVKQVTRIKNLYNQLTSYRLVLDIPKFK